MAKLIDTLGRTLRELRVSVTERCNLRCRYCMPAQGIALAPKGELLDLEELARVVELLVAMGVEKVRLTGGEPLVRNGLETLVGRLAKMDRIKDLALTTNGLLLADKASALAQAGLQRVNVSLDSLDPETFAKLTRGGKVEQVLEGLRAARALGLGLKLNCVVMRGVNDQDLLALIELAKAFKAPMRFIEYMPLDGGSGWSREKLVTGAQVLDQVREAGYQVEPMRPNGGVARLYKVEPLGALIGLISSISEPFCDGCSRLRLSSRGLLHPCLFGEKGWDLRTPLRAGRSDAELKALINQAVFEKPRGSPMALGQEDFYSPNAASMCPIGG